MKVDNKLTLNILDLSSTETREGTLVLGTSDAGGANGTFQVGDRSTSRRATFSGNRRVRHLRCGSFCGSFLVVLGRVRKLEMIQRVEGLVHDGAPEQGKLWGEVNAGIVVVEGLQKRDGRC